MIQLRLANRSEIKWINECYDKVNFIHSNYDKEIIAIAEYNGQKVGLGRLVTIDDDTFELGGIYVVESFRGKGIAKEVVRFLLNQAKPYQTIYCIPFEHLVPFYQKFGFIQCINLEMVPKDLLKKFNWCKEKYNNPTSLLVLKKNKKNLCE